MKVCEKRAFFVCASILFLIGMLMFVFSPVLADETPMWTAQVFSSGVEVVSPVLLDGTQYRIMASESWWYNYRDNLAADAYYYTTDPSNSMFWGNYFPAPDGHSFLQIDVKDVNWGPFSNGETNHTYTIHYTGRGLPLTFRIVDWMDGNYTNNVCHIHVQIFKGITVGGRIADSAPWDMATYLTIGGLIFTVVVTVPIAKYHRKIQKRKD